MTGSATPETDYVYAGITRASYTGTTDIKGVWGAQNIGRQSGTGTVTDLIGGYNFSSHRSTGNVTNMYGSYNLASIEDYEGTPTIDNMMGAWSHVKIDSAGASIDSVFGGYSNVDIIAGTVGDLIIHRLDLDYDAANSSDIDITNLYYLYANETTYPTISGESYFIKSLVNLPSLLSGDLAIKNSLKINHASNGWFTEIIEDNADDKSALRFKTNDGINDVNTQLFAYNGAEYRRLATETFVDDKFNNKYTGIYDDGTYQYTYESGLLVSRTALP